VINTLLGATILFISSNTGVMGASRLVFSMSHFRLVGSWFSGVHPRFHTPSNSIVAFSLIGLGLTVIAFLTPSVLDTLANLYAFGATLLHAGLHPMIRLRFVDPHAASAQGAAEHQWRTGDRTGGARPGHPGF
jgi:APA family basic amino acid/polyamine antiporter